MENKRADLQLPDLSPGEEAITFGKKTVGWYRHAAWFSLQMVESGTIPFTDPKKAFAVLCKGEELGLQPFSAWGFIYMTKAGRLAIQTKGALAVVQASPVFESYKEWIEGEGTDNMKAVAIAKRRGHEPVMKEFSLSDATKAGLLGQRRTSDGRVYDSTYATFLKDMLQARARGRALDIAFADVLGGIPVEGVAEDIDREEEARSPKVADPAAAPQRDPILEKLVVKALPAAKEAEGEILDPALVKVISDQVDEVFGPPEKAAVPAGKQAAAAIAIVQCPRCGGKANEMGGCDVCGWPGKDLRG